MDARNPTTGIDSPRTSSRWRKVFGLVTLTVVLGAGICASLSRRAQPDLASLYEQAQREFKAGRLDAAEETLDRLARIRPNMSMERMARAQIAVARQRPKAALDELARVSEDDPLAPLARLLAGQIELKQGRVREAESYFLATLKVEPKTVQAHRELIYIYNVQHRQKEVDAHVHILSELGSLPYDELLHWSQTRNLVWNPERDCEALSRFIAAEPEDRLSRLALADGLRQLGRLGDAEKVLAPLPDDDQEARTRRVLWALDDGNPTRADQLLAQGLGNEPAMAKLRGQLALLRKDARTAVVQMQAAVDYDPTDRAALFGLSAALKLSGDEKRASHYLEMAKKHDALTPLITRASTNEGRLETKLPSRIGAACEAAGRIYEALAWHKNAIARDPLDGESQSAIFRLDRQIKEQASSRTTAASQGTHPHTSSGAGPRG